MEVRFTNTMVFQQPFFGKGPKSFESINMFPAFTKFLAMINYDVFPIKLKRFIRFELIRVKNTPLLSMIYNLIHNCFCGNIIYNSSKDSTLSFQYSKYLDFLLCTTSSRSFFLSSKITFITLYFTRQFSKLLSQVIKYLNAIVHVMIANHIITKTKVSRRFSCRYFKTEVEEKLEILFNSKRTVFVQTLAAFKTLILKSVQSFIATIGTLFSMNNSFNYFQHNQVNLTLGPKNDYSPRLIQ